MTKTSIANRKVAYGNRKPTPRSGFGDRLLTALGKTPPKKYSDKRCERIVDLIEKTLLLVDKIRETNKITKQLDDNSVIDFLFPNADGKDERKRLQTTTQCVIDFLNWCKGVIVSNKVVPYELLHNFVYDTAAMRYLGASFARNAYRRSHYWIPMDSFEQTFSWFCYGIVPRRLTSEFMCIFELRQTMESKFKSLLGIKEVQGPVRIAHNIIPDILKKNLTKENFSPKNGVTITQIMHVYEWTDISIHTMSTDFVWIVWKAMMVCNAFFQPVPRSNGMISIHDSFELSERLLNRIRNEFVTRICQTNTSLKQFAIVWGKPEAAIVDDKGIWVDISCKSEVVTNSFYSVSQESGVSR